MMGFSCLGIAFMNLISALQYRYATKMFDSSKVISSDLIHSLLEAARLAPSSYGLQPYRYTVIARGALKDSLSPLCYNQPQIADCDVLVVGQALKAISIEYVDSFIALIAQERQQSEESLSGYRDLLVAQIAQGMPQSQHLGWAQRQLYLSAGIFIAQASLHKVDVCPMEGFQAGALDEAVGLDGYQSTSLLTCGYRLESDPALQRKKVRWPTESFVVRV